MRTNGRLRRRMTAVDAPALKERPSGRYQIGTAGHNQHVGGERAAVVPLGWIVAHATRHSGCTLGGGKSVAMTTRSTSHFRQRTFQCGLPCQYPASAVMVSGPTCTLGAKTGGTVAVTESLSGRTPLRRYPTHPTCLWGKPMGSMPNKSARPDRRNVYWRRCKPRWFSSR